MEDIIDYIIGHFKAPKAAEDLLDALEQAISILQDFPYSGKVYQPIIAIETEYRMLYVKNYYVFYTVVNDVVEIQRIMYSRMNLEKRIK